MSKFTKALEKVQDKRGPKETLKKGYSPVLDVQEMEKVTPKREVPYFDRGVTTVKNTSPDERVVMMRFPDSMLSEQYRMLRTSLKSQLIKNNTKVILLSSSIHSEGKTVTASNLSVSLAEQPNTKVLLIDADLRRGKISHYFGFGSGRMGLTEVLLEDVPAKDVMLKSSVPNLTVIPRGNVPQKPSEAVSSSKLPELIDEFRKHYDYIIIDAPPIMSVADAGIIGRSVDGILFIVQVGRTPKSVIKHSQQLLRQSGCNILGCILTNVEFHSADYRYYKNYYSYYSEGDIKEGFRERSKYEIQKAGWSLKNMEEKFNQWWDKKVLKKK